MQELAPGAMATVFAAEEEIAAVLSGASSGGRIGEIGGLSVAALNAPGEVVLSGPAPDLDAALERLRRAGIGSQRLRVARAFHSPSVEPMLPGLAAELQRRRPAEPTLPWISCRTGAAAEAEVADPAYWLRQAREPVRFAAGLRTLYDLGFRHFLEIGPHHELLACGRRTLPAGETRWLASLARGRDDWEVLLDSLAELYCEGAEVDWAGFDRGYPRRRRPLPAYPFARRSHWIPRPEDTPRAALGTETAGSAVQVVQGGEPAAIPPPAPPVLPAEAGAPRLTVEEVRAELCALFGRVLQVDPRAIAIDTPFMDLGAASLILIDAVGAIERRFGVAVARQRIFRDLATVGALADFVVAESAAAPAALSISPAAATPVTSVATVATTQVIPAAAPTHELAPRPAGPEEVLDARRQAHLDDLVRRYTARTAGSRQSAQASSPALADSRTAAGFRPAIKEMVYPIVVRRAAGAHLWDLDGNRYVDTTMGFGVQLFGHGAPFLAEAVRSQLDLGLHLGPQAELAGEVARQLSGLTGVERVAFCNSGTEAVMTALRLARTATGRSKIALFSGSYHGHFDGVLVRSGTGPDGWGVPAALGVPAATAGEALVLDYGDPEGTLAALRRHGRELAAVLVEPVQSRRPALQPKELLAALRELTREMGIALIFDEVLLGFRIHQRGAQAWAGVEADLVTYGKILGGGMPIAAVTGKAAFLDGIDGGSWRFGDASGPTAGATFFAGTFCKHPLAMAAARAVLTRLAAEGPGLQERLNDRTTRMAASLNEFFAAECPDLAVDHCASLFRFRSRASQLDLFFHHLVERGVYVWEGRTCFLSTAHTEDDVAAIEEAVRESARELCEAGFFAGGQRAATAATAVATPAAGLPLTAGQAALWRAAQMSPEAASAYNQSLTIDLTGALDLAALRQALAAVVERHEVLRAVFSSDGRRQTFAPRFALVAPLVDLSSDLSGDLNAGGDPEAAAARWLAAASRQPFELAGGPLLRAAVLRLAPAHHRLVVLLHHLVTDGRSMEILIGDLAALYGQAAARRPLALPPPRQFREVAAALEERRSGPRRAAGEAYWRARFATLPPDLELPLDRPRPAARGYAGGRVAVPLPTDLLRALERTAGEAGATLFSLYLAGYALLLARLASQDDLVIAVLADQRPAELRDAMGYCVNVLPLRCRVDAAAPVQRLLATVQEDLMDALGHRDQPFSDLLRELPVKRDGGRPPLASVALNLDRYDPAPVFPGLTARVVGNAEGPVRWDLMWNLAAGPRGTVLECDFDRALFEGDTITRWAATYLEILRALAADPGATVADVQARLALALPVVTAIGADAGSSAGAGSFADTRSFVGVELASTRAEASSAPTPESVPESATKSAPILVGALSVAARIAEQVRRRPAEMALCGPEGSVTYGELAARAGRLAGRLVRRGVEPGDRVAVLAEDGGEVVTAMLACFASGAVFVPLDPAAPAGRIADLLADCGASLVLTDTDAAPLASPVPCLALTETGEIGEPGETGDGGDEPLPLDRCPGGPESLAYLLYTSGSTGRPKGVAATHANLAAYVEALGERLELAPAAWAVVSTLAADLGYTAVFAALCHGGCLHVIPRALALDAEGLAGYLAAHPVDGMKIVPTHLAALLHLPEPARLLPRRWLVLGGDRLDRQLARRVAELRPEMAIFNHYGPTETTVGAVVHRVEAHEGLETSESREADGFVCSVPIGHPLTGTHAYLLDAAGEPVPNGETGEIHLAGAGVTAGYLGQSARTAERFLPDPFGTQPGGRMYRTGDLARRLPDGALEFLRRADDQVKIRGHRVEPGEVEAVLRAHPGLRAAAVTVRRRAGGEPWLAAYAVPGAEADAAPTADELAAYLAERLPSAMIPAAVVLLPELPLSANGKLDRQALPDPAAVTASSGSGAGFGSSVEVALSPTRAEASSAPTSDLLHPAVFAGSAGFQPATSQDHKESRQDAGAPSEQPGEWAPVGAEPALMAASEAPAEMPLANRLAALWAQALGLPSCGVDDDFFALGGDSIVAIEIAAGARRLGLALTPQQIFTAPTVSRLLALAAPVTAPITMAPIPVVECEPPADPVPLTPVQCEFFAAAPPRPCHWNLSLLLCLRRPVPADRIADALAAILRHHDALRLRIVDEGGERGEGAERRQLFAAAESGFPLERLDLTGLGERAAAAAIERAASRLHAGLDLARGPLVRAALAETDGTGDAGNDRPARLILVIHHLAVDVVSLRLLLADLETACRQLAVGEPVCLPAKTTAFGAWAARLAGDAARGRFREEIGYWRGVLADEEANEGGARLPCDFLPRLAAGDAPAGENREGRTRAVEVHLTAAETRALLHGAPAAPGARAQDLLLATLAAAFRPWTGRSSLLVELEGHGREPLWDDVDTARTVGWFTTHFPVRLNLPPGADGDAEMGDTELGDVVEAVAATLRAVPHRGLGYGVLRHLAPDDDAAVRALRALAPPQVTFNYLGQFERAAGAVFEIERFAVGRERDAAAPRRTQIAIDALVVDGRLRIAWRFSRDLHRPATIRRLAERQVFLLRQLLTPAAGEAATRSPLPVDFAAWSREELDELAAGLA